jgi:hypothetical protein
MKYNSDHALNVAAFKRVQRLLHSAYNDGDPDTAIALHFDCDISITDVNMETSLEAATPAQAVKFLEKLAKQRKEEAEANEDRP